MANQRVYGPHALAWFETDDREALRGYVPREADGPRETVTFARFEPQRVELKARMKRHGLVILASTDDPTGD